MEITCGEAVGALYIRLLECGQQCSTLHLTDEISLNPGEGDIPVGIEVVDAREVLGREPSRKSCWGTANSGRRKPAASRRRPDGSTDTGRSVLSESDHFFHQEECPAHSPRLRQDAAAVSPLRPRSETSFRHFAHSCLLL